MDKTMTAEEVEQTRDRLLGQLVSGGELLYDLAAQSARVPGLVEEVNEARTALARYCGQEKPGAVPLTFLVKQTLTNADAVWKEVKSERDAARKVLADTADALACGPHESIVAVAQQVRAGCAESERELVALRERGATLEEHLANHKTAIDGMEEQWEKQKTRADTAEARVRELNGLLRKHARARPVPRVRRHRLAHVRACDNGEREHFAPEVTAALASQPSPTPVPPQGVNPDNILGPSLYRRLRRADMKGEQYTLTHEEVACVVGLAVARAGPPTPPAPVQGRWTKSGTGSSLRDAAKGGEATPPQQHGAADEVAREVEATKAQVTRAVMLCPDAQVRTAAVVALARICIRATGGAPIGERPSSPRETLDKARVVEVLTGLLAKYDRQKQDVDAWNLTDDLRERSRARACGRKDAVHHVAEDLGLTLGTPPPGPGGGEHAMPNVETPFTPEQRDALNELIHASPLGTRARIAPTPTQEPGEVASLIDARDSARQNAGLKAIDAENARIEAGQLARKAAESMRERAKAVILKQQATEEDGPASDDNGYAFNMLLRLADEIGKLPLE